MPFGIVSSTVSLEPVADRYTSFQPDRSAGALPALTISTNSFVAAPVTPVMNSLTRIAACTLDATQVMTA